MAIKFSVKKYVFIISFFFFAGALIGQVRIMPLGNSITMGRHGEPAGYRDDLSHMLLNAGINFTMVGSMNDGTGFYPHHEGHSGWRADEILDNLNVWLNLNPPNIVLLHIGTNDISQGESNESTLLDIENILDMIHNRDRSTIILLCNLIPRFDEYENRPQRTEDLNLLIENLYTEKKAIGWDIYFVNQNNAIKQNPNWTAEWMDNEVHPNDAGYHVMAETFFQVLLPLLSNQTFQLAGHVRYYSNQNPIGDVSVHLGGAQSTQHQTNSSGYFQFSDLAGGEDFSVWPEKNRLDRYENSAITMYNAALALRHAVGIDTLDQNQQLAGDVDRSGMITAFDAALIARYVVELDPLAQDHVGEWDFLPATRIYSNLNADHSNVDYSGILLGDVAGAWTSSGLLKAAEVTDFEATDAQLQVDNTVSVPIIVHSNSLLSFNGQVEFPENMLRFKGTSFPNFKTLLVNPKRGKVKFGYYSANSIAVSDTIGRLEFEVLPGAKYSATNILVSFQINQQACLTQSAKLNVLDEIQTPLVSVGENYPNPFNPSTTIPYRVRAAGTLNIKIFNILGQVVREFPSWQVTPGKYEQIWDGRDDVGTSVASGVYVCQFQLNGFVEKRTLVKLQ